MTGDGMMTFVSIISDKSTRERNEQKQTVKEKGDNSRAETWKTDIEIESMEEGFKCRAFEENIGGKKLCKAE